MRTFSPLPRPAGMGRKADLVGCGGWGACDTAGGWCFGWPVRTADTWWRGDGRCWLEAPSATLCGSSVLERCAVRPIGDFFRRTWRSRSREPQYLAFAWLGTTAVAPGNSGSQRSAAMGAAELDARVAGNHGRRPGEQRNSALDGHGLPHGRSDLGSKGLDQLRIVAAQDERADPVLQRPAAERVHPVLDGSLERSRRRIGDGAVDVQQPEDLRRIAAGLLGRLVDDAVAALQVAVLQVGQCRQPAIGLPAHQTQHAGAVGAQPDRDVVGGGGATLGAVDPVVRPTFTQRAPLGGLPDAADDASASMRASTASLPLRRGPPIASIASQNPPVPSPRATRPPESRSREATERARTAGWRSGRFSTLPLRWILRVWAATQLMSVHVSVNRGW